MTIFWKEKLALKTIKQKTISSSEKKSTCQGAGSKKGKKLIILQKDALILGHFTDKKYK